MGELCKRAKYLQIAGSHSGEKTNLQTSSGKNNEQITGAFWTRRRTYHRNGSLAYDGDTIYRVRSRHIYSGLGCW